MNAIFSYWRTTVPEWREDNERIADLMREHPEGSLQLVLADRTEDHRETHILKRGDFLQPERVVTPGTAGVSEPAARGTLPTGSPSPAGWWTGKSPTTARSIVNRVWQAYFGTGIVATAENFGTQCEPPVESGAAGLDGGGVHGLGLEPEEAAPHHRDVRHVPAIVGGDAGDAAPRIRTTACWRAEPGFRVDAETVRDIALAASGLLNPADRRAQRIPARAGLPLPAAGQLFAEIVEAFRRRGQVSPRACTPSASAAFPFPCCRPSTRRTARCPACGARAPTRRCRR